MEKNAQHVARDMTEKYLRAKLGLGPDMIILPAGEGNYSYKPEKEEEEEEEEEEEMSISEEEEEEEEEYKELEGYEPLHQCPTTIQEFEVPLMTSGITPMQMAAEVIKRYPHLEQTVLRMMYSEHVISDTGECDCAFLDQFGLGDAKCWGPMADDDDDECWECVGDASCTNCHGTGRCPECQGWGTQKGSDILEHLL